MVLTGVIPVHSDGAGNEQRAKVARTSRVSSPSTPAQGIVSCQAVQAAQLIPLSEKQRWEDRRSMRAPNTPDFLLCLRFQADKINDLFSPLGNFVKLKEAQGKRDQKWEDGLYPLWEEIINRLKACNLRVTLKCTPQRVTVGNLRPDIAGYPSDAPCSSYVPYYLELVGELKDGPISHHHFMQLEEYARQIFAEQPFRPHLYAFLANDSTIVFVRFQRPADTDVAASLSFVRTPVLPIKGEGASILLNLLDAPTDRGSRRTLSTFDLPGHGRVIPTRYLGHGRHVYAYAATLNDAEVVVKQFKEGPDARQAMESECTFLAQLAADLAGSFNGNRVPSVLGQDAKLRAVVLTPVATPLSRITSPSAPFYGILGAELIRILRVVHQHRVVHRDLSFSNIYLLDPSIPVRSSYPW